MTDEARELVKGLFASVIMLAVGWVLIVLLAAVMPPEPCPDNWNEASRIYYGCD